MDKERIIIHCPEHGVSMSNGNSCVLCQLAAKDKEIERMKHMVEVFNREMEKDDKEIEFLHAEIERLRRALELACAGYALSANPDAWELTPAYFLRKAEEEKR